MPIWINAIGVCGMGMVYGYALFYILKRYLPPLSKTALTIKELLLLLTTMGISGAIGTSFVSLGGVNYVGPYGIGFFVGAASNVILTLFIEWKRGPYKLL